MAKKGKKVAVAKAAPGKGDTVVKGGLLKLGVGHPDIARALAELQASGTLTAGPSRKISARIDAGVLAAAAQRLGLEGAQVSDVVNASLAMAAADRFKQWRRHPKGALSDDFELAI